MALIDALEDGLAQVNEDLIAQARIRLRVALDEGVVHRAAPGFGGPAVTEVCRLRDAAVVKEALKGSSGDLVVVAADHLYRDVLAAERRVFAQASVAAKELAAMAWIYLPAAAPEPGAPSAPVTAAAPPHAAPQPSQDSPERTVAPRLSETLKLDPGLW